MKSFVGKATYHFRSVRFPKPVSVFAKIAHPVTLLAKLILMVTPIVSAAEPQKDCRLRMLASISIDRSSRSGPTIPIVVQNIPVRAWVNTQSAFSVIDQQAVERLGLKTWKLGPGTPGMSWGGNQVTGYTIVPAMSLGNARFKDRTMLLTPTRSRSSSGMDPLVDTPIAYLGMDVLTSVDIELDLGHDKINLFSPDHCSGQVVYWADRYDVLPMRRGALKDLYFVMELNGKKLQTQLSTGDWSSSLFANVASKLYAWDENPSGRQSMTGENGSSGSSRAMTLTAGGLTVLNAQIRLRKPDPCVSAARLSTDNHGAFGFDGCNGVSPLHLGMNVLTKLRIYLSTAEQKMYLTATDAHQETSDSAEEMTQRPGNQ